MESLFNFVLLWTVVIIVQCYCTYIPIFEEEEYKAQIISKENLKQVKIYDYGTPSDIQELYDIQNGNLLPMARIKYIKYKQQPELNLDKGKTVVSQKAFNFVIKSKDCPEKKIYEKALLRAEEEISKALEIKNTINVDVYIEDFCANLKSINCMSLVGMTYAPIYIALKDSPDGREYAYPQALAKQLNLDKEVDFAEHDLIVYLNTHMAKEDFSELVVTHEILHGLGFMGNGVVVGKSIGINDMEEELFSPYVYYDIEVNGDSYNYQFLGFLPFTVYEKHIVSLKDPNTYLYRTGFDEFYHKSVNITSYSLNALSSTKEQFSVLSQIYKDIYKASSSIDKYRKNADLYLTNNSIGFKASDGEIITLQSFDNKYLSSSTACHVAVPFKCESFKQCFSENIEEYDNNYLMYFSFPTKFKTSEMLKKFNNNYGLIGPNILKILTTIGWTEKGKPEDQRTYYVTNDQFPDVYNNLFEINAINKMNGNNRKESNLVSASITLNSHILSIIILILLLIFIIHF